MKFILSFIYLKLNLNHLFLLIIPIILLVLINRLLYYTYLDLKEKSTDLYQYKITSFSFTFICIVSYIILFVLIVYGLRIMYLSKTLDLKALYNTIYPLIFDFIKYDFISKIYNIILILLILLLLLLILTNIQMLCYKEFFKLHLFLHNFRVTKHDSFFKYKYTNVIDNWGFYSSRTPDLITGYLMVLLTTLKLRIVKSVKIKVTTTEKILYYILGSQYYKGIRHIEKKMIKNFRGIVFYIVTSKYYKWFFNLSPLFFLIYDCYYNNWVLIHIFYFMLVYGPLILIKRITNCTFFLQAFIIIFLQSFYYDKKEYIKCIPKDFKTILDIYLLNGLKSNAYKIDLSSIFDFSYQKDFIFIIDNMNFLQDDYAPNMYTSTGDVTIIKMPNGKYYRMIYEYHEGQYELGEEWVVLNEKYG